MKRYQKYMDEVKTPDTLHQRLMELEAPAKRTNPWKRYGCAAAALALVCGLGAWGLGGGWAGLAESFGPAGPESVDIGQIDIAREDPNDPAGPGEKVLGGYDVTIGSGPEAMVAHYVLPCIDYGETGGKEAAGQIAADWDIPKEAARRDLSKEEIVALLGGEEAVNTHLDWGGYELTGWAAWYENGSFWGAYIMGYAGPLDHFEFAVTKDQLPPTCIANLNSVTQEIRGLTVTAGGHDSVAAQSGGVDASSRSVSFMKEDHGYRFDLTGESRALTEERVSRLVCRIAGKGLALTYDCPNCGGTFPFGSIHNDPFIGADDTYTCGVCGNTFPVGTVHNDPDVTGSSGETCPVCGKAADHTHPYDPDGTDPSKDSPRDRGENWCGTPDADPGEMYTCPICGKSVTGDIHFHLNSNGDGTCTCDSCGLTLPEGEKHYHVTDDSMCSGYPVPGETYTCPICEKVLPVGVEHSHKACGYPLAPGGDEAPAESFEIVCGLPPVDDPRWGGGN